MITRKITAEELEAAFLQVRLLHGHGIDELKEAVAGCQELHGCAVTAMDQVLIVLNEFQKQDNPDLDEVGNLILRYFVSTIVAGVMAGYHLRQQEETHGV